MLSSGIFYAAEKANEDKYLMRECLTCTSSKFRLWES